MISSRVKQAIEEYKLQGIYAYVDDVHILRVGKKKVLASDTNYPRYHAPMITWGSAALDYKKSNLIRKTDDGSQCLFCRSQGLLRKMDHLVIDIYSWNGDDIFIPRGINHCVVTSRFVEVARTLGFTNVDFVPSEEYKIDYSR